MTKKMTRSKSSVEVTEEGLEAIDRAAALLQSGELREAERLLKLLAGGELYPGAGQLLLGRIYLQEERVEEAIACFSSLVKLLPESEAASLGMFHALWKAGRTDDAFAEMHRYLADHESWEYRRLCLDLKVEGILPT